MENQIQQLIETIKADYAKWSFPNDNKQKMTADFNSGLGFKIGKKYIKIMMGNGGYPMSSVWGFVVNVDDSWATPTRNKARGNIIEGDFSFVQWTGPAYI